MNTAPANTDAADALQHQVSPADGSPLHTTAASNVFNWRGPGTAAAAAPDDQPAAEPPAQRTEEETMATTRKKRNGAARASKSSRGSPQLQICSALLQLGDLSRDQLAEACADLNGAQISSALNNAKSHDRVEAVDGDEGKVFRLTKAGKAWTAAATGEQPPEEPKPRKRGAAGRKSAHRRKASKRQEVDTSPAEEDETAESTFRCGVMSDGCFFITKDGVSIEIDAEEHKQMLHYLERMAETA